MTINVMPRAFQDFLCVRMGFKVDIEIRIITVPSRDADIPEATRDTSGVVRTCYNSLMSTISQSLSSQFDNKMDRNSFCDRRSFR